MYWLFENGNWCLWLGERRLGHVSRDQYGWAAETELNGLTTGSGDLEWAKHELWTFCERRYCR